MASALTSEQEAEEQIHPSHQVMGLESCLGAPMQVITSAKFRYEGICFHIDLQQKVLGLTDALTSEQEAEEQIHPSHQVMGLDSCVGAPMQVITSAKFRYEGICFHIDLQQKVLGLKDVKIYGGEVQETDNGEILPVKTDYDTVLLRGSLIKELQIISPEDIPSTSTLPDHFIIQCENNRLRASSTMSQGIDAMSDILSRLYALLQGISDNKSESFWSPEFWSPLSSSSSPAPTLKELDELDPPAYLPGFEKSSGAICHPPDKKKRLSAAEKGKQISFHGPSPKLYISAIQSLESAASSERQKTREQQQQPPQSPSDNEKDNTLDSLSADSGVGRGEVLSSEETRTTTDELGAYPRQPFARGIQGSRRGRGLVGLYRGGRSTTNNGSRGRGRMYWAPRGK